ncbi:MAG: hypothetical protein JWN43_2892 [Gammaproteobacteria bacterium]|nr:hypothetical protein [Gammaproteobacteria bacterium]
MALSIETTKPDGYLSEAFAHLWSLAPYAAVELILPGGSLIAFLLWLYRRRKGTRLASANPGTRLRQALTTCFKRARSS